MQRFAINAVLLVLVALISGCGGRSANPVSQYQPGDENRTCEGLKSEIANNEVEIAKLLPYEDATGKNVALGVTGAFFIVPLFFMDFKDGEETEIKALQRRNQWLREVAYNKNCEIPPSKLLAEVKQCSAAKNSSKPWIGEWASKTGDDVLAIELTAYQMNGQLITRSGVFEVDGRVDDEGNVEGTISSSWARGALKGKFPNLDARASTEKKMGSVSADADTRFVMCL